MHSRFFRNCSVFFFLLMMGLSLSSAGRTPPPSLAQGQWHKIGIAREGIYKLSYQFLQKNGIINSGTNPQHIRVLGQGGGMLPQPNAEARPDGLLENAIFIAGEEDGVFDPEDYILFYGQGPDKQIFDPEKQEFEYEKNLYSDTVFYFISVGIEKGKRISTLPNKQLTGPAITTYNAFAVHETEQVNLLNQMSNEASWRGAGRRWLGEALESGKSVTFQLPLKNISPNTPISIKSAFGAAITSPGKVQLNANGYTFPSYELATISDPIANPYSEKGTFLEKEEILNSQNLSTLASLTLEVKAEGVSPAAHVYLDYLTASTISDLQYQEEPLFFRSAESLKQAEAQYKLQVTVPDLLIWDITDPQAAALQQAQYRDHTLLFGATSSTLKEYVAFRLNDALEPLSVKKVNYQNLREDTSPELVIVSHASLLSEAQRLADFRRQHDGLQVKVVTPEQVYNDFSSGAQDVTAIRDYMRYLYRNGGNIKYLLLFGRGYFDYKKRTSKDLNLVPTYYSYNSTHPIYSYSSDDYYGFLEDHEGSWEETESGNHSLEIGIGRLPVKTKQEARQVVDKLIAYSTSPEAAGSWRNTLLFVADDEDGNAHHSDADKLAKIAEERRPEWNIDKMYLGAYPQVSNANGHRSPKAVEALQEAVKKGAFIINYTGHGNWERLTDEFVITKALASKWDNPHKLPLFVTATCEYGQHDSYRVSGAEELLLRPDGGAIGLFTASRPVFSHTNYDINSAFYKSLFPDNGGAPLRLGDVIRITKNKNIEVPKTGVVNRNFLLLGDPSLMLAYPAGKAVIDELIAEGQRSSDTLGAFTKVKAVGSVFTKDGMQDHAFNGIVEAVVYEKPSAYETLEIPSTKDKAGTPRMPFTIRDNVIFRGRASVQQGSFSFSFVVPKSIMYKAGQGKISLYAIDKEQNMDAGGYFNEFSIGGERSGKNDDQRPPEISLYLNDSSFVDGEKVGQESILLAYFKDESGINLTNSGVEGSIVATLDGQTSFELNDYYISDMDNHMAGSLQFPLSGLLPGRHRLSLSARDTHNNISVTEITFEVGGKNDFEVYLLQNHPNPFNPAHETTRFVAEHSRAGENVEASLQIFDLNGKLILEKTKLFEQSQRRLDFQEWDPRQENGKNLLPGVYLFKVILRSQTDGSLAERTEKFVILN